MNAVQARAPKVHYLRTVQPYFWEVKTGAKPFEARRNDRDFQRGDTLVLMEWNDVQSSYSGDYLVRRVTFILAGLEFGVRSGFVVMGLAP